MLSFFVVAETTRTHYDLTLRPSEEKKENCGALERRKAAPKRAKGRRIFLRLQTTF
jgi:exosome complex RNA-binding protein Csl4